MLGNPDPVDDESLTQIYTAIALHALLSRADVAPWSGSPAAAAARIGREVVEELKGVHV